MKTSVLTICEHCERQYEIPNGMRVWVMEFAVCPHCKWPRNPEKYVHYWGKRVCQVCRVPHVLTGSRYRDYCELCYQQVKHFPSKNYVKLTIKQYNIEYDEQKTKTDRAGEPGSGESITKPSSGIEDGSHDNPGEPPDEVGFKDIRQSAPIQSPE